MTEPERSELAEDVRRTALAASHYRLDQMIAVFVAYNKVAVAYGRDLDAHIFAHLTEVADDVRMDRLRVARQAEAERHPTIDLGLITDNTGDRADLDQDEDDQGPSAAT